MEIKEEWFKEDFKQKYFLYCPHCYFLINKFAHVNNND